MPHAHDPITRLYRSCDPDAALKPGDTRYVDLAEVRGELGKGWRQRLARSLRQSDRAGVHLVAGFLGDGKTTELQRLKIELMEEAPRMAVVYIDGGDYLNPYDYSFNEILLAVISETGRQLKKAPFNITIEPSYFTKKIHELQKLLLSDVELEKLTVGTKSDPFELAADFALRARDSHTIREKLWNALRGDHTTLSREFASLVGSSIRPALKKQGYQDLVIIVDWLEKLVDTPVDKDSSLGSHRALFLHHAQTFKSWDAQLVLTIPIDLVYSVDQENLRQAYGCEPIVINEVGVADCLDSRIRDLALSKMREVLRLRAEEAPDGALRFSEVFENPASAEELIRYSGGHLRALMILLRQCCSFQDALPLTPQAVAAAKREERLAAARRIRETWFPLLARVHKTNKILQDADHFEMLRTLCVLTYANGEPKYAVDPSIVELERFKEAMKEM